MPEDIYLKGRPLIDQPWGRAIVDIIIPFHGQYDRVGRTLASLYRGTSGTPFRVILVDDGSPNRDFLAGLEKEAGKRKIDNMILLRRPRQQGFGAACWDGLVASQAAHKSKPETVDHPYVCILQSDCLIVDTQWLRALFTTYERGRQSGVKFVSSRMDNPTSGDPRVRGVRGERAGDIVLEPATMGQIVEEDCFVPLTATFCHKELFGRVGMFKQYPYGMYEDLEFACRLQQAGYKQAISGASFVHHDGGATFRALASDKGAQAEITANFDRCCRDIKLLKNQDGGHT